MITQQISAEAIKGADVVVIGTPLSTTEKLMPKIAAALESKTILTDVGSAKGSVVDVARSVLADAFPRFCAGASYRRNRKERC